MAPAPVTVASAGDSTVQSKSRRCRPRSKLDASSKRTRLGVSSRSGNAGPVTAPMVSSSNSSSRAPSQDVGGAQSSSVKAISSPPDAATPAARALLRPGMSSRT